MTRISDAPETVHVKQTEGYAHNWWGVVTDFVDEKGVEYVRADLFEGRCNELVEVRHALRRLLDNLEEGDFISTTRIDEARAALSPAPVMDAVKQGDA